MAEEKGLVKELIVLGRTCLLKQDYRIDLRPYIVHVGKDQVISHQNKDIANALLEAGYKPSKDEIIYYIVFEKKTT